MIDLNEEQLRILYDLRISPVMGVIQNIQDDCVVQLKRLMDISDTPEEVFSLSKQIKGIENLMNNINRYHDDYVDNFLNKVNN
ncbi:hypothetical protein UFOVP1009_12 [uncultured Caudovirales phage]|uniref:Uncharacterized protein n=1 Tax=uncultured Caudovirales phage TaxID=2100421 RepID=A0A6J5Q8P1_9CAUD|nr:hypothetical protein UFOVP1009_12 [uncultured Caudovirales phage]